MLNGLSPRTLGRYPFMDIIVVTAVIASLFLVIGAAEPLAARLRLPYTVILAGLGILIALGATFLLRTDLTDAFNPVAEAILDFPIRSNVFFEAWRGSTSKPRLVRLGGDAFSAFD